MSVQLYVLKPGILMLGDYSPLLFRAEDYDYWMRVNVLFNLCHFDFAEKVYEQL
jgi:hypothetical protein